MVFDGKEFAEFTGASIRMVRYAVRNLRDNDETFRFRTVFNHDAGAKGSWRLLVALAKHADEPIPTDGDGRDRHARQELRKSGLKVKAHCISRRLQAVHWDNCKVDYDFAIAVGYVHQAMIDGWSEEQIQNAYRTGLQRMHGTATDLGVRFQAGSTINRARRFLDATEGSPGERIQEFYTDRREMGAKVKASIEGAARGLRRSENTIDRSCELSQCLSRNEAGQAIPQGQNNENE